MAEEGSLLYVPEDLEENILVRLPVKSIVRFKSVCKRWHSLFRSEAFRELYFDSLDKEDFIPTCEDLGLICQARRRSRSVMGPLSNGIYALTSILSNPRTYQCEPHTLKIALFNPVTRQVKFANPFPDEYLHLLSRVSWTKCNVHCGINDDNRVVVLIEYKGSGRFSYMRRWDCFLVFLYTWQTGEWEKVIDYDPYRRKIGLPRGPHVFKETVIVKENMMACSQKLLNGCWHWMIVKDEGETRSGVLSFDFERKSLRITRGPPRKPTALQADVFVLQDHLAAIVLDDYNNEYFPRIEIWRKTKTEWSNIYSVQCNEPLFTRIISHGVDYYQVEEEIRIRRLIFADDCERHTFDDDKGHLVEGVDHTWDEHTHLVEGSRKISLSVGGILKFTPTFEHLPL